MKICMDCKIEKPKSEFYKRSNRPCGLRPRCIACDALRCKQYGLKNKEKICENTRIYTKTHKEERKQKRQSSEGKQKRNIYVKKIRKQDTTSSIMAQVRSLLLCVLKNAKIPKNDNTVQMIGCSREMFLIHMRPRPEGVVHIDHICPNHQGKTCEEKLKLQHYTNLRWMTAA